MASTAVYAQKKTNPLSYPYYICGTTTIDPNDGTVTLRDISYKGFSCKKENFKVGIEDKEKALFRFEEITTNPSISLRGKKLQYWRQDEFGEWITDAEGGTGIAEDRLNKYITIMLVLDCSKSLGTDFDKVKKGAISFIEKLLSASSSDYVRFGIIGFSSIADANRQTFGIRELNTSTYAEAIKFINNLSTNDNTALYYAVDKAVDMLSQYVTENFDMKDNYEGTYILTFTDGIDNSSQFRDKKIFTSKQAYEYIQDKVIKTQIRGSHIESYIIGAKGVDLKTSEQISKFKRELENLIPDKFSDRFTYLENMQNLEYTFSNIAESLVKKWQNLLCYTSLAHEGGVCWTYGEVPVPVKPTYDYKNLFLGLNVGAGVGMEDYFGGVFSFGIDFAYPITNKFGLGAYFDVKNMIGTGYYSDYDLGFAFGVMTTIGDYSSRRKSFVGGIGVELNTNDALMTDMRGGVLFRNGLYIMGDIAAGSVSDYYDYGYDNVFAFNASIKVGFNFGKFIKIRKKR